MNQEMQKFKLGVMSSLWQVEAKNSDIAVGVLLLKLQSFPPIAIYEPEEAKKSKFSFIQNEEEVKNFVGFVTKNFAEIKAAKLTLIKIS